MSNHQPNDPSDGLNAALAATLNGERVAAGLTFDELARTSGIPKRTLLRKLSTTERHLNVDDVARLATALGLRVVEVLARAEDRLERANRRIEGA